MNKTNAFLNKVSLQRFLILFMLIFYIPYFLRLISGFINFKIPYSFFLLVILYLITLPIILKNRLKINKESIGFIVFQLLLWNYFLLCLLINLFYFNDLSKTTFIYLFASISSYYLIPIISLIISIYIIKIKLKKASILFILFLSIILITAFIENIIFYLFSSNVFERLKESGVIMSYYTSFLNFNFFKTFSIFPSGLEFGFFSLIIFIFARFLFNTNNIIRVRIIKTISFLGILLSFTRVVWLGFLLYLFFKNFKRLNLRIIIALQTTITLLIIVAVYFSTMVISKYDIEFVSSVITRFHSWKEIFNLIGENFSIIQILFGYGYVQTEVWNPFKELGYNIYAIDNTFFNIFLLGGLIGLIIFFFNYYFIIYNLIIIFNNNKRDKFIHKLLILWIIFPILMNFNVLVPSLLFLFLYSTSIFIIMNKNKILRY